jgi:4-alpha-glucanotransferase
MNRETASLHRLARLYRVQTSHYDGLGRFVTPPPETLLSVLKLLGAPVERVEDCADAIRSRRAARWSRLLEPVIALWEDRPATCRMRVPASCLGGELRWSIALESGATLEGVRRLEAGPRPREIDGTPYVALTLALPRAIPAGYHRLSVELNARRASALLISAPATAFAPICAKEKSWGLFAPLYALHSRASWGAGDFSDLQRALDWTEELGGDLFSTLPLLSLFLDGPSFDPSPYAPVSRLFWNEFYIDVTRAPELAASPEARALVASPGFEAELSALRAARLVDYRRVMALKRSILERLAAALFSSDSPRRRALEEFATRARPEAQDFAEFRAHVEVEGRSWSDWPEPSRSGRIGPDPRGEPARRYHLYAQWLAHEQLAAIAEKAARAATGLYLDFPLGVHAQGYDVWRYRGAFALGASGGAPPDLFFTKGQDWGFPPLHPEGLREEGYRYYVAAVRHQLTLASVLRIDHVMGLHRLFWVPHGARPEDGVYVRYPAEELYAILCLESRRRRAAIVGENLGTVPPYVNEALARRAIRGMDVGQFVVREDPARAIDPPPAAAVASLATHDTPTFAAFWQGSEIDDRVALGLLDAARAGEERERRRRVNAAVIEFLRREGRIATPDPSPREVLAGWLAHLAAGPAEHVLISLEDLWLETEPQNTPGTWLERANWQRKTRRPFEEYCNDPDVLYTLSVVRDLRSR